MKVHELIGELLAYPMHCEVVNENRQELTLMFRQDYERAEEWVEIQ